MMQVADESHKQAAPVQQPSKPPHGAVRVLLPHLLVVVVADADLPLRVYPAINRDHHMVLPLDRPLRDIALAGCLPQQGACRLLFSAFCSTCSAWSMQSTPIEFIISSFATVMQSIALIADIGSSANTCTPAWEP